MLCWLISASLKTRFRDSLGARRRCHARAANVTTPREKCCECAATARSSDRRRIRRSRSPHGTTNRQSLASRRPRPDESLRSSAVSRQNAWRRVPRTCLPVAPLRVSNRRRLARPSQHRKTRCPERTRKTIPSRSKIRSHRKVAPAKSTWVCRPRNKKEASAHRGARPALTGHPSI